MRVLIVTTSYPRDEYDMSGIFIKRLAVAMSKLGATITVIAPGDVHAKANDFDNDIRIIRFVYAPRQLMKLAYGNGGILENIYHSPWLVCIIPFFIISMIIKTINIASDCDIIHANWLATGLLAIPAQRINKKPLLITLRGSDFRKGASRLLAYVAKRASAITAVNQKWAEDLREIIGDKVHYTPNGVEKADEAFDVREKYGIRSSEIIALYVGVLRKVKGADVLAETAMIMNSMNPLVRFLIIGPGDPKEFGLDRSSNIICVGALRPHEALAAYARSDLFVLPSRHEGRPNALLEAMASGLPSVATRLPGVLEVLTEECGVTVDTENPLALAEGIHMLAMNPQKRKEMGSSAALRIKELSLDWETSARRYLDIFRGLVQCAE